MGTMGLGAEAAPGLRAGVEERDRPSDRVSQFAVFSQIGGINPGKGGMTPFGECGEDAENPQTWGDSRDVGADSVVIG